MNAQTKKAYILYIISMAIFGTSGIYGKLIPLSSGVIALTRGIIGSGFLFAFIMIVRRHGFAKIRKRKFAQIAFIGLLLGANWVVLFEAYKRTTIAISSLCYYMAPTLVILVSPIFLKEKLTTKKVICALLALVGITLVSGVIGDTNTGSSNFSGIVFGLISAVFYAGIVIISKKVVLEDAYHKTIIQLFFAGVAVLPYVLVTEDFSAIVLTEKTIILLLVISIVNTGIAFAIYFTALKTLKAQSVAILSYIDPVTAMILSFFIFGEKLSALGIIGAVLIIGSSIVSEIHLPSKVEKEKL